MYTYTLHHSKENDGQEQLTWPVIYTNTTHLAPDYTIGALLCKTPLWK